MIKPYLNIEDSNKPVGIETVHHIYPKDVGGLNTENNRIKLYNNIHEALHRVFGTMPPHEQIQRIIEISETAITDNFKRGIEYMTNKDDNRIYKRGIFTLK